VSDRSAWKTDPFTGTVVGDRLYGLGAVDMKASVAAMMIAVATLAPHADWLRGTVQLQVVCDEEEGAGYGTIFLADQIGDGTLPRPDAVLMAEYSDLKVLHAERGTLKFEVTFYGTSTHTMTARVDGVNPIVHAALAVLALDRPLSAFDPKIGYGIISVNMIQAGQFASQVPAECKIVVDRRMLPGETDETCLAEAAANIKAALKDHPEARFELARVVSDTGRPRYSPPNATPWERPVVQAVARAHEKVTGEPAEPFVGWYGATDGRLFRLLGIDTVNYGPHGAHAHGTNEYVDVPSLETQLKVFVTALLDMLA
jgi:succinyl-diaminopimelate desuccinylase